MTGIAALVYSYILFGYRRWKFPSANARSGQEVSVARVHAWTRMCPYPRSGSWFTADGTNEITACLLGVRGRRMAMHSVSSDGSGREGCQLRTPFVRISPFDWTGVSVKAPLPLARCFLPTDAHRAKVG